MPLSAELPAEVPFCVFLGSDRRGRKRKKKNKTLCVLSIPRASMGKTKGTSPKTPPELRQESSASVRRPVECRGRRAGGLCPPPHMGCCGRGADVGLEGRGMSWHSPSAMLRTNPSCASIPLHWAPAQQPNEPQTLQPEPCTSWEQSRAPCRQPGLHLIHHQVVVTLVPVAVLRDGRNVWVRAEGRGRTRLCSPQTPRAALPPPPPWGFSARFLAGFLPPTQQPHTHITPRRLLLLLAPLQPHLLVRRALWRCRHALSR